MEDLNLPIIRKPGPKPKILSMDDYLKFVHLHLKYTHNKTLDRKLRKMRMVNVQFKI